MSLIQGDALSSLLCILALDGLKFNGTHPHLFLSDEVNMLGESVHTMKKIQTP